MNQALLIAHIIGGTLALLTIPVTLIAPKRRGWHVAAGRMYVAGMGLAVASAVPLAMLISSPFLGAVAAFSAYLVASGWRWIRRPGPATSAAWGRGFAWSMIFFAVPMVLLGGMQLADGDTLGIVLLTFAGIGVALAVNDLRSLGGDPTGKTQRTILHLGRMIGASIATVTAVLVVNVELEPAWLVWLAPTMVGSPMIAAWSIVLARNVRRPA